MLTAHLTSNSISNYAFAVRELAIGVALDALTLPPLGDIAGVD